MKVGVGIMACKERAPLVAELLKSLDATATVTWDTKRDRWDTGKRALLEYKKHPEATHWLCLQDDAVVCRDLVASVERAIRIVPNQPISLFFSHGNNGPHQRMNRLAASVELPTWLEFEGPWWGVAVVFPVKLIDTMVRLADKPQATPAYDKRLSRALRRMKVDCRYVLPSLVDHRIDGPSMIAGREQEERHAWHFVGKDTSALDIPWGSMPVIDARRNRRITPTVRRTFASDTPPHLKPRPKAHKGPVRLSFTVMAHPARAEFIPSITDKVDATVVMDTHGDRWDTGARAMAAYDPDATHHCVLQDDAIVCDDLAEGLTKALEVVGDNPVGLYVGNIRPAPGLMGAMASHAERNGLSWMVGEGPMWGVGVCLPVSMIAPMLDGADTSIPAYDRRMGAWFKSQGIWCWYTMPSLVDHREGTSLIYGASAPKRHARRFVKGSALDIDWTRLPAETTDPYISYTGAGSRRYHLCLFCGYYTPVLHSIRRHVRVEHAQVTVGANAR